MKKTLKTIFFSLTLLFSFSGLSAQGTEYYASLKKDEVNLRAGPGERFPILWIYQERGYPVKVLDKYDIWRQVQEPDGSVGWVHKNMLSDRRTALIQEEGSLTSKPDITAKQIAFVEPGTIAHIIRCPAENKYCLLSFNYQDKDIQGWFPRQAFWGIEIAEEID